MPESNGTVFNGQAVVAALDTFLVANGWAQHDTDPGNLGLATPNDTVYVSTGLSGVESMYVRVTNPAKQLNYDNRTGAFTVGETVTGGTSGATGLIVADIDLGGNTGTLHIVNLTAEFENNEALTDPVTGAADANGRLVYPEYGPEHLDNWFENLIIEGYLYWDSGTHAGTGKMRGWANESGRAPLLFSPGADAATDFYFYVDAASTAQKQWYWADTAQTPRIGGDPNHDGYYGGKVSFDGRKWWRSPDAGSYSATFRHFDLPTFQGHAISFTGGFDVAGSHSPPVVIGDRQTGKHRVFKMHNTGVQTSNWKELDLVTGVWSNAGTTVFGSASCLRSAVVWDGADRIYGTEGNNQSGANSFGYYEISTGTWTSSLAGLPLGRNTSMRDSEVAVYIPSGRQSGLVSGVNEDLIYMPLGTGVTTALRFYRVTSDTWHTLVLPVAWVLGQSNIEYDGKRYLYYTPQTNSAGLRTNLYRWDLVANGPGSGVAGTDQPLWSTLVDWKNNDLDNGQRTSTLALNHAVSKVPLLPASEQTYFCSGDADSIKLVLKHPSGSDGRYFWCYFGRIDNSGFQKTQVMTTTLATVPGAPTTVTVDDTSDYTAGEQVLFFDPSDGKTAKAQIISVPSATTFTATVSATFTIGTLVGVDPNPWCIASDLWQASANLDRNGHESDRMGNIYWLWPGSYGQHHMSSGRSIRPRTSPSVRDRFQVYPYQLWWHLVQDSSKTEDGDNATTYPNPDGGAGLQMHHSEMRGQLFGVYDIDAADEVRGPKAEQTITINGRLYRIFPQQRLRDRDGNSFSNGGNLVWFARNTLYKWVVVGPID